MRFIFSSQKKGFTLIETLVGVGVFLVIATASYQAYVSLFSLINLNQYKILALSLANEQFEIVRNLPYADVGVQGSIPNGKIPHVQNLTRGNVPFIVTMTIRNIDQPFDGTIGGSPNDLSPADNKLVEVEVECPTCTNFTPVYLTTTVAPKNLETASTNGALFVKVFDSNGIPISGADVHIVNSQVTPTITIDDVTDNNGILAIVDAVPGTEAYQITVTKAGYSTDRTYLTGTPGNPNPTKPHATVIIQQVTQVSFSIDPLSTLSFSSVTPECVAVGNIDFSLRGAKSIGAGVPKYSQDLITNSSGVYSDSSMEPDSYTVTGIDGSYDIVGINPLNAISLNPNTTQNVSLIVAPKDARSLLVTVKDSSTLLPLADASVNVTYNSYDETKITGRGSLSQTDWSGSNAYTTDDGGVDVSNPSGEIKLKNVFGNYSLNGWLESSTIDTGSPSNFYNLVWSPTDQPVSAGSDSVRLQFATNSILNASTTWDYKGPDGTSATFYTSSNSPLSTVHNGDRYARFKAYLSTASSTVTPNVSDVSFTVTSSCTPPGQVVFSGLSAGTYHIEVSKTGYTTSTIDVPVSANWQEQEIILAP